VTKALSQFCHDPANQLAVSGTCKVELFAIAMLILGAFRRTRSVLPFWRTRCGQPLHPDDAMAFGPEVTDVDVEQLKAIEPLVPAQAILKRSSNRPTSSGLTMWLRRF
jgi:hypothetical protein